MPLYGYNKTITDRLLPAGTPIRTLLAAPSAGARGRRFDLTAELRPDLTVDPQNGVAGGVSAAGFALVQADVAAGNIECEWTGLPEYSTSTLVVGSAQQDVAENTTEYYVSPAGNDANFGTAASTFLSWARAWKSTPVGWHSRMRHNLAAGTMPVFPSGTGLLSMYNAPVTGGDGGATKQSPLVAIGTPVLVASGLTTAGGSQFVLTDGAAAFGALRGLAVRITASPTGSLVGRRRLIAANTGTTIRVLGTFGVTVPIGTTFVVESAGSVLTWGGSLIFGQGAFVGMRDITLKPDAGGGLAIADGAFLTCENVTIDLTNPGSFVFVQSSGKINAGSFTPPWANDGAANPFSALRTPCGIYIKGDPGISFVDGSLNAIFLGNYVMDNCDSVIDGNSRMNFVALDSIATGFTAVGGRVNILGNGANRSQMSGQSFPDPTLGILNYNQQASGNLNNVNLLDSGGDGAQISEDAYLRVGSVGGSGTTVGVGVRTKEMGRVGFTTSGGVIQAAVTGAGGDVLNGANPFTYAGLAAAGGDGEVDASGPTLNRMQVL